MKLDKFTDTDIIDTHGQIEIYRALYDGRHYRSIPKS